jgi:hypothetical protein
MIQSHVRDSSALFCNKPCRILSCSGKVSSSKDHVDLRMSLENLSSSEKLHTDTHVWDSSVLFCNNSNLCSRKLSSSRELEALLMSLENRPLSKSPC